jgi:hypothetical protein
MGGSETREKAARTNEVLASIGRGLREQYDAPLQPLSKRLAELGKKSSSPPTSKAELSE